LPQAALHVDDGELVTVLLNLAAPKTLSRYVATKASRSPELTRV
jgi:hypothetical protein